MAAELNTLLFLIKLLQKRRVIIINQVVLNQLCDIEHNKNKNVANTILHIQDNPHLLPLILSILIVSHFLLLDIRAASAVRSRGLYHLVVLIFYKSKIKIVKFKSFSKNIGRTLRAFLITCTGNRPG